MKVNKKFVGAIFVLITLIGLLIYIKGTGTKQEDGKKFNKYIVIVGNGYKTKNGCGTIYSLCLICTNEFGK